MNILPRPCRSPLAWTAASARHTSTPIAVTSDGGNGPSRRSAAPASGPGGAGTLALVAALRGEGQEWLNVAPFFLAMGAINLYIGVRSPDTTIERKGR